MARMDTNREVSSVLARARRDRGITLGDLSVTLSAFALVLLALAPVLSRLLDLYHLRGAAQQMFAELQRARLAAVMENNRFQVSVIEGSADYVLHDDGNNDGVDNDGSDALVTRTLAVDSPGVTLTADSTITFAPNGAALSTGRITVSNRAGATKVIAVSAGGRIRLQ
jgi:Tfp pilus assembly protein FimT